MLGGHGSRVLGGNGSKVLGGHGCRVRGGHGCKVLGRHRCKVRCGCRVARSDASRVRALSLSRSTVAASLWASWPRAPKVIPLSTRGQIAPST